MIKNNPILIIILLFGLQNVSQSAYARADVNINYIKIITSIASEPKNLVGYVAETVWVHYGENGTKIIKVFSGKNKIIYFTNYKHPVNEIVSLEEKSIDIKWKQMEIKNEDFNRYKIIEKDLKTRNYNYCLDRDQWIVYVLINGNGVVVCTPDCDDNSDELINKGKAMEKFLFK